MAYFRREPISYALVLSPTGGVIGVDDLRLHADRRGAETRMTVPKARVGPNQATLAFLWGSSSNALGVRPDPNTLLGYRLDWAAFAAFRELHCSALSRVVDPSVQAFLKFLRQWEPEEARLLPQVQQVVGSNLAFRFQYDDELLHEKHAAHVVWTRMQGASIGGAAAAQIGQD
jgi:hypothetical protein